MQLCPEMPHTPVAQSLQHCQHIDGASLCTAAHNDVTIFKSLLQESPLVTPSGLNLACWCATWSPEWAPGALRSVLLSIWEVSPDVPSASQAKTASCSQQQALLLLCMCRFSLKPGPLMSGLVSCTGAQFCGVAIIETKNRAQSLIQKLEEQLEFDRPVRIHWTGCPNSCGQVRRAVFLVPQLMPSQKSRPCRYSTACKPCCRVSLAWQAEQ